MEIGLYEHSSLPDAEKLEVVFEQGLKLLASKTSDGVLNLYALSNFYVEVWYDHEKDKVLKIKAHKSTKALDKYLDDIDLEAV